MTFDQGFYDNMQETAVEMLDELGAAAFLIKNVGATYDPSSGLASGTPTQYACRAVVYPWRNKFIDHEMGSGIGRSELRAILASSTTGFNPAQGDTLTIDGQRYIFESVDKVSPGNINIIFTGRLSR